MNTMNYELAPDPLACRGNTVGRETKNKIIRTYT